MISLIIYRKNKSKIDITEIAENISWAGDINTYPRNISVDLKNTDNYENGRLVSFDVGDMALLYYNEEEIFRGYIFTRQIDSKGSETFTAYDELIYATKNEDSIIVKNTTASEVIKTQMKKFGITIGDIQSTSYKIAKAPFQNRTLSDIWNELFDTEKLNTGKSFRIFSTKGQAFLYSREKAASFTISINDVISATSETSIEDLRTRVKVSKGSFDPDPKSTDNKGFVPYFTYTVSDSEAVNQYGIMQHMEDVDDKSTKEDMKKKAAQLLEQLNKPTITNNIEFIGNVNCITGKLINVNDELSGLSGSFYITADSHTFSNGIHKMQLQLSKKIV